MKYLSCLLLLSLTAAADEWTSTSDGELKFVASFEGEPLPGRFPEFDVSYTKETLTVSVKLVASDMGDDEMNTILHDAEWLGIQRFAQARFSATDIQCDSDGGCVSIGQLDLKGVQQPFEVSFTWAESGDTASLQGESVIDRTLFDVGSGEWSGDEPIAIEVKLTFDIRLARQK